MFDIGWSELLVLGIVSLIVLGPKDFPLMMRKLGNYLGAIRRMANDFQRQVNEAGRKIEEETLGDAQKQTEELKTNLQNSIDQALGGVYDNTKTQADAQIKNTQSDTQNNARKNSQDNTRKNTDNTRKNTIAKKDKKKINPPKNTNNAKENLSS